MVTTHDAADSGPEPPDQLLWNIKTVILKTGLSRASIYRYMKRERFPPRRRVGPNRVAWVPAEVMAWIETRPQLTPRSRGATHDRHRTVATRLAVSCALHGTVQTTAEHMRSGEKEGS